jgi:hypothetical protein
MEPASNPQQAREDERFRRARDREARARARQREAERVASEATDPAVRTRREDEAETHAQAARLHRDAAQHQAEHRKLSGAKNPALANGQG